VIASKGEGVYKQHRIHTARLSSGVWVASVVRFGAKGSGVEIVRGEYQTSEDTVSAAKRHIDHAEGQETPS
jgi:hypothetical protein